jgi:hypothetical protein
MENYWKMLHKLLFLLNVLRFKTLIPCSGTEPLRSQTDNERPDHVCNDALSRLQNESSEGLICEMK